MVMVLLNEKEKIKIDFYLFYSLYILFFVFDFLILISSLLALAKLPFLISLDLTLLCIFFVKTLPANFKKIPDKKEGIFLLQNLFLKILVLVTLNNFI